MLRLLIPKSSPHQSTNLPSLGTGKVNDCLAHAYLCCFLMMFGLKVPLLRNFLVWLWFCLQLFLSTVETVWSSFPYGFRLLLTYVMIGLKAKFAHMVIQRQRQWTDGLPLPSPTSTWPSSKRTRKSWEGVHHIAFETKFKPKPFIKCCMLSCAANTLKIVWPTHVNCTVSYIQTLAVERWGQYQKGM